MPLSLFRSLQWCVDIVLSINEVHILFTVIIVNSTQVDLVSRVAMFWGIVAIIATQAKDEIYCDRHLEDMFLLLFVEVFGYLH